MRRIAILCVVGILLLTVAVPVLAQESVVHVVQPGENLYRIALRYGVTVNAIVAANGLPNANHIYVGQRLVIPVGGASSGITPSSSGGTHTVQRGENLYRIALRYGTTVSVVAAANGIVNTGRIYVGQQLVIPGQTSSGGPSSQPASGDQTYTVQRGDTLASIALRHGVSLWSLVQANAIRNPSLIYVGQVLTIPSGGSATTPTSPAPVASSAERWIDVDLSQQTMTAYEGSTPVRSTLVSSGLPATPTPTGQFRVYVMYVSTTMSGPGYYLTGVPYTLYFYRGYALHGTYWHSNFGHPMSHGCINLPTPEAQWIYNWASIGTLINIHY